MNKKIKIGIVGMGFIADFHFKGFKENPDAEITGMTQDFYGDKNKIDQMKKELNRKCSEWNIKPYGNFNEMAEDPEIEALVIGSINPYHFEQIKKGFKCGKHLLVEKPVVTDFNHFKVIKELYAGTEQKIFPGHNFVYRNAVIIAKDLIKRGELGKIIQGSFIATHTISEAHSKGWRAKKELSYGGALMDSGHHLVYQSLFFLGKPVKLQAFKSKMILTNMDGEDTAQINLLYPDNSLGVILQSWGSNYGRTINGIRIFGDKGEIAVTDALYFNGEKIDTDVDFGNSFINQAKAFTDYILYDKKPASTLADVENCLKIIFDAYESAEKDIVVTL
ncbi:MAG: Gfo/Idh/MocA family protein [Ignavibacteria bacterium]